MCQSDRRKKVSVTLTCISLIMNLHEHFFMFVSHFYISFVCELLVHIFSPFSLWVFGLCPSTFKVLYIWVTGSLCICYIFSKSGSCLLTLFMVFFVMQNFKFLYVVHFINLFLLLPLDLNQLESLSLHQGRYVSFSAFWSHSLWSLFLCIASY